MNRFFLLVLTLALATGCRSIRRPETPAGPHFRVLTYNLNWGGTRPDLAAKAISDSAADIVCLQETTPEWEQVLRRTLSKDYSFVEFRHSGTRYGGGLAFLSKLQGTEVAFVPSQTGWFDGWIMNFETALGPVQVLNVHLRPPISDSGSWVSGYFSTRDDQVRELELFYGKRARSLPMLVAGDFNASQTSPVVKWLQMIGLSSALPRFDASTPTWRWKYGVVSLRRRIDHILFSPELHCSFARVIREGASDHFPVEAVFASSSVR